MHKSFELKAVVPQGFRGTRADHFARGSPFNLADAAFSGLLPRGIGFSHSRVATSLPEFLLEVTQGLLFRAISYHGRGNSITMEHDGQGFMSHTLAFHRMRTDPSKGCGVNLCHFVSGREAVEANIVSVKMVCGSRL
jgi:hypothetical protein